MVSIEIMQRTIDSVSACTVGIYGDQSCMGACLSGAGISECIPER